MIVSLIRHAKSSWKYDLEDQKRPLSIKGIKDAHLVFKEISNFLSTSPLILCSSATRTVETAKIFSLITKTESNLILVIDDLYTFNNVTLEKIIKNNTVENLIIFGHNNAITDFVNKYGNYYIENVPTCGVVMIKFEDSNTILPKKGVIIKTIFPRDLR